ncbi:MAG: hypothetical protein ACR2LF_02805 [Jatrophihabitantaceae bacterium]
MTTDTAASATGSAARLRHEAGVEGNARLSASNGLLLVGLLAVEGFTVLSVRQMITLHVYLGIVLIGPVLLKTASTIYRFARYYGGVEAYRRKGPPHPLLRLLGPLVILSSLALLGTGVALIVAGPARSNLLLTLHQASFIGWVALMTVHVLGHVRSAARESWRDVRPRRGDLASRRRAVRAALVVAALVAGVGAATALMPSASAWTSGHLRVQQHEHRGGNG